MFADSYKYSQPKQMPSGTVGMFDYLEARGGMYDEIVPFSAQYMLKRYFSNPITKAMVDEAAEFAELHGEPFEYAGWMYIVNELGGMLPIRIRAVAEGTVMPVSVPLMTMESTDEKVAWIVSWFETFLLKSWYGTTVATRTRAVIKVIEKYRRATGGMDGIGFAYHDFSDRGCTSVESAAIAGMARLAAGSMGTDNFNSLRYARKFYGIHIAGFSIVASEHSTVTSWGKDGEFDMYEAYIERFKSKPILACVMDSYNIFEAMKYITSGTFKEKIESDDYPMFVIRPDSGNPVEILNAILNTMEDNSVKFTMNDEGYKVFNKYRIIWGDGTNIDSITEMLEYVTARGYSADNIAFGSGGWGSQVLDRDTSKFAIKCSSVTVQTTPNGQGGYNTIERDVFKDPITDKGKTSKKGRITTYWNTQTEKYEVGDVGLDSETMIDVLEIIFEKGILTDEITLDEVRANGNIVRAKAAQVKKLAVDIIEDVVANYLFYDRKEDEDLPQGEIEKLIESGELTIDELVEKFMEELTKGLL